MDVITRHCSTCGEERLFEQPPCGDGHGADCPERACTGCGSAILVAPFDETAAASIPDAAVAAGRPRPSTASDDVDDDASLAPSRAA